MACHGTYHPIPPIIQQTRPQRPQNLIHRPHKNSLQTPSPKPIPKPHHIHSHLRPTRPRPSPGAETTNDVAPALFPLIATAMDQTESHVETLLLGLKPDLVFFDFAAYWIPKLGREMGFKTVFFSIVSPALVAYASGYTTAAPPEKRLLEPPPGYPDPSIRLRRHELAYFVKTDSEAFGSGIKLGDRFGIGVSECDAYASKGCREIDGPFVDFLKNRLGWDTSLVGPVLSEPAAGLAEPSEWDGFLSTFEPGSVVFCCLGSEQRLSPGQFQELVLGLELAGSPFLAVARPPCGAGSVEEALPEGFLERVGKRGAVHGGWVRQEVILAHQSVGCFVTHCGTSSVTEALGNRCQLVLIPHEGDHVFQARLIGNSLKAGVEVERDEHNNGWFGRESVCKAIRTVMDKDQSNLVGTEIRNNCDKLHKLFQNKDLEAAYIDEFCHKLHTLVLG